VEGGVEHRDLRYVGKRFARRPDAREVRRVVQRRERAELLDRGLDLRRHERRLAEARAAVHDAVPDPGEVGVAAERVECDPERGRVVGHVGAGFADALDDALAAGLARYGVDDAVLHG
jgi:hypothetical protein